MQKSKKNIIAFVMTMPDRYVRDIARYAEANDKSYRLMVIRDSRTKKIETTSQADIVVECDFSQPLKIAEALLPYQNELLAITCRTEQNIARFAQVIPQVPYLRTPTTESLRWATDKYHMRRRLRLFDSSHAIRFTRVKDNTKKERARVIEKIKFPMIIKPANLAGSLFVSICYHEEELEKTLRTLFRRIKRAYATGSRQELPTVVAEEYLDGDLYSIDSYVNARGEVSHCPLVRQKTARQIGHDDFYNYQQITPTALKAATVAKAEEIAETAIHALGLRSTTAHIELMKIDDDWKVIEVGPRCGGARDVLYRLSCDINHTMNDIAVRIPRKPVVPKKCQGYAAYVKYFADTEGQIMETKGIKKIEALESFHSVIINKKVGDRAVFARNGGRSIFNAYFYNTDRSKLLADLRRMEQMVDVKVESSAAKRKKTLANSDATRRSTSAAKQPRTQKRTAQ